MMLVLIIKGCILLISIILTIGYVVAIKQRIERE